MMTLSLEISYSAVGEDRSLRREKELLELTLTMTQVYSQTLLSTINMKSKYISKDVFMQMI